MHIFLTKLLELIYYLKIAKNHKNFKFCCSDLRIRIKNLMGVAVTKYHLYATGLLYSKVVYNVERSNQLLKKLRKFSTGCLRPKKVYKCKCI